MEIHIVIENLKKNNIRTFFVESRADVVPLIKTLMPEGSSAGSGGSVTLDECGVTGYLRSGGFKYFDRFRPGITAEETEIVFSNEKQVDFYFSSCNALTESGELYFVDGRGNRVGAIAHGPKNVIVVTGKNKIVKDLNEAVIRVKTTAAPKNSKRVNAATYCAVKGRCVSLDECGGSAMTSGCKSKERICCHYLVSALQRTSRITVILVNEDLGY